MQADSRWPSQRTCELEFVTPDAADRPRGRGRGRDLPGEEGYFGVLPGHAPLLAALRSGEIWYRKGKEKKYAFVAGGFVEVLPDRVSILAQVAEHAEDIDIERAEAAKRRAEERLAKPIAGHGCRARAYRARATPIARLEGRRAAIRASRRADMHRHDRLSSVGRRSDPGLRRESNEDAYCARPDLGLYHGRRRHGRPCGRRGRVAARGRDDRSVHQRHARRRQQPHLAVPVRSRRSASTAIGSKAAFRLANRRLARPRSPTTQALRGMATTAAAVLIGARSGPSSRTSATAASTCWRDGELQADDARPLVGRASRCAPACCPSATRGGIRGATSSRARSPAATIPEVEVDRARRARRATAMLLCSDGLLGVVADDALAAITRPATRPLEETCQPLIDAANDAGGPDNITVASCSRSMWHNLAQLVRYRGLIQSLVARELKARYRGSVLGFFWSFVNPLLLLLDLLVRLHEDPAERTIRRPSRTRCSCSAACCRGHGSRRRCSRRPESLIAGGNLIKKVLFPAEVLPIVSVLSNMVHFFLGC